MILALKEFAIVSNNCWGGEVYKELGITYNTPFIGLFVPPKCYVELLSNFEFIIKQKLEFILLSKYEYYNEFRKSKNLNYPIGLLNKSIEIHFLHYSSELEAYEKWNRRLDRMIFERDKLFIKFCDREIQNDYSILERFDKLNFPNKICFTSKKIKSLRNSICIYDYLDREQVEDGVKLYETGKKYFNQISWVTTGKGCLSITKRLLLKFETLNLIMKFRAKKIIRFLKN